MMGISSRAYLQNEVQNLQNLSEQMTVSGLPDKSRGVLSPSTEVEMAGFKKAYTWLKGHFIVLHKYA